MLEEAEGRVIPGEQRPAGGQCTARQPPGPSSISPDREHPTGPSIPPQSKHPFPLDHVFHLGPSISSLLDSKSVLLRPSITPAWNEHAPSLG